MNLRLLAYTAPYEAALISPALYLLAVYSSFVTVRNVPNLITDIFLADALHSDHTPCLPSSSDRPPHATCNVAVLPVRRYVTAAWQHERHPARDSPGIVHDRGTGEAVRPHAEELENVLGLVEETPWQWSSATWPAVRLQPFDGGCSTTPSTSGPLSSASSPDHPPSPNRP